MARNKDKFQIGDTLLAVKDMPEIYPGIFIVREKYKIHERFYNRGDIALYRPSRKGILIPYVLKESQMIFGRGLLLEKKLKTLNET
jgi:hypothetical protein